MYARPSSPSSVQKHMHACRDTVCALLRTSVVCLVLKQHNGLKVLVNEPTALAGMPLISLTPHITEPLARIRLHQLIVTLVHL